MELLEIIIYILKIFSLVSVGMLIISYLFFKMKDRSRIKPYMLVDNDASAYEVPEVEKSGDVLNYRKFNERFKVLNEERYINERPNGDYNSYYRPSSGPKAQKMNVYNLPESTINYKPGKNTPTNIYNLYSPATSEPMHKLKINAR
jgi:hypothetical protein